MMFKVGLMCMVSVIAVGQGCSDMNSILSSQLTCTFPQLSSAKAQLYAEAFNSQLAGSVLSTTCEWAAFLGNVGTESMGLTEWTQIPCEYDAPYCGRGPLQITGESNYAYCASEAVCSCSGIVSSPEQVSDDTSVGVGTAACVWSIMSGSSLNQYVDGSQSGFLQTACTINAGHPDCGEPNGWSSRLNYWNTANTCLANNGGAEPPPPPSPKTTTDAPPPPPPSVTDAPPPPSPPKTTTTTTAAPKTTTDYDDDAQAEVKAAGGSSMKSSASEDVAIVIGVALAAVAAVVVGLYVKAHRVHAHNRHTLVEHAQF